MSVGLFQYTKLSLLEIAKHLLSTRKLTEQTIYSSTVGNVKFPFERRAVFMLVVSRSYLTLMNSLFHEQNICLEVFDYLLFQ